MKPRTPRKLRSTLLAGLTLSAVALVPIVGSAALTNSGSFGVRAVNSDNASISAIRGLPNQSKTPDSTPSTPSTPTPDPVADSSPLTTLFTVDTSLPSCVDKKLDLFVPQDGGYGGAPTGETNATISWGDGTKEPLAEFLNSHSYADAKKYQVSIDGTFPGMVGSRIGSTVPSTMNSCVTSIDHFGSQSQIINLRDLFSGSKVIQEVAAPPQTLRNSFKLFYKASQFNGDTSDWVLPNIVNSSYMFSGATSFAGDLSNLKLGKNLAFADHMFQNAWKFDSDISGWDMSTNGSFAYMFENASSFNGDVSKWSTGSGTDFTSTFDGATGFKQDVSGWDVSKASNFANFYRNSGLTASQVPARIR